MPAELIVLRLVHVLGGIFWVGSGLFTAFFLVPALGQAGPGAAGPVMGALQQRRLFTVLPIVAVLTILSGLRLLYIASGGFDGAYLDSPAGRTYFWSGMASIAAFLLSLLMARPAAVRAGQIAAQLARATEEERGRLAAEAERLRRRSGASSVAATALLVAAAAGMAIGRYAG